eukprot:7384773-Prymnesium_polylepis.2
MTGNVTGAGEQAKEAVVATDPQQPVACGGDLQRLLGVALTLLLLEVEHALREQHVLRLRFERAGDAHPCPSTQRSRLHNASFTVNEVRAFTVTGHYRTRRKA